MNWKSYKNSFHKGKPLKNLETGSGDFAEKDSLEQNGYTLASCLQQFDLFLQEICSLPDKHYKENC